MTIKLLTETLIEHPASLPLAVLLALVLLTLAGPAVWRMLTRLLRRLFRLPAMLRIMKLPGLSHLSALLNRGRDTTPEHDPENYFVTDTQVGELQARLEAELNGTNRSSDTLPLLDNQSSKHNLNNTNASDNNSNVPSSMSDKSRSIDTVPASVSRREFGELSQAVATLCQQTRQQQLADSSLQKRLKSVAERESTRSKREADKAAATQRNLLAVKSELQSLQHLVVRQHREIKRLEINSPENRLSRTRANIIKLAGGITARSSKIKLLSMHAGRIEKLLSAKDNTKLTNQKNKLRVLIAKHKLDLLRERKALRLQRLIYKVQKLPYNERALFPLQLQKEITALKKNQHHLSELLGTLQNRKTEDVDSLKQLRDEINESFRQLSERIELQEGVLRATSVQGYSDHSNPAANDESGVADESVEANQPDSRVLNFNVATQQKQDETETGNPSTQELSDNYPKPRKRSPQRSLTVSASTDRIDDLKQIFGIGDKLEVLLNKNGIFRYEQIAQLNDREIDVLSEKIGCFPDRIRRDGWVTSAQQLVNDRRQA